MTTTPPPDERGQPMPPLIVILLLLAAAVLHASWHVLVKSQDNRLTVLVGMNLVASAIELCALAFAGAGTVGRAARA